MFVCPGLPGASGLDGLNGLAGPKGLPGNKGKAHIGQAALVASLGGHSCMSDHMRHLRDY